MEQRAVDEFGRVETRGVEYIPLDERNSSPWNVAAIATGQAFAPTIISLGWLPIVFGLGWWSAVTSILVGLGVGSVIVGAVGLLGPRTGTSSAVSSGAMFGVHGRLIGSILGQTGGIGFYALTIWAGGTILVGAGHRLLNTPDTTAMYVLAYAVLGVIAVLLAVWGHASLVAANKWFVIPVSGLVMLIGFIVLADKFDAGYAGGQYLLGSFGATWWLSTVVCGGSVTLVLFVNDWTRRIDPRRWSAPSRLAIVSAGSFTGAAIALLFGAFCATLFAPGTTSWGQGFGEIAPAGYLAVFAIVVALAGTMVHGTVDLYSAGLDLASLILRLKRVPATLLISIVGQVVVVLATLVWNAQSSLTAYITLLTVACTAWAAILITGHLAVKGRYHVEDLQVLNRRQRGGVYWYRGGWNVWAVVCWAVGTTVGAMFTATDWFVGPFSDALGGVDISWILGGVLAAVLYAPVARTLAKDSLDSLERSEMAGAREPVPSEV